MIIKKKYIKNKNEELLESDYIEKSELSNEKNEENINKEIEIQNTDENEITENDDLDISIDNIKFDPREERREGTRRRGYRRTQDRNLLSRAQQEAISIKEAAKKEGYEEGISNSQKDLQELRSKFTEFYSYKDEVFQKVSECILEIAVEIAKKIINKESEIDKEMIIPIIKEVVSDINKTENNIILRVMPKDVELVKDKIPEIFSENSTEAKITVIPDNKIQEGGVIVETSNGIADATIETRLSIIEKALTKGKEV